MSRTLFGLAIAFLAAAGAHAQGIEGTWKLAYISNGNIENTAAIVKLKIQDGKTTGEMVAASPRLLKLELKSITQDGPTLRIALQNGPADLTFEATVPKQPGKQILGVLSLGGTLVPAMMIATEDATLDAKTTLKLLNCPPLTQAKTMLNRPATLRFQAAASKDPDKKKDLLKQAAAADKKAKEEVPALLREVLDKHADSPGVLDAALTLIRGAKTSDAKPEDIKAWATTGLRAAKTFGPRLEADFATQIAMTLLTIDDMEKLAVDYARQAEKAMPANASPAEQVRTLQTLVRALKKTAADAETKAIFPRIDKFDAVLDAEYNAKMPGFKGTVFEGRKSKSERAVFMELFTGSSCPPCVAADLAFDVLQKSYKPSELVLIQYHLHIPGPDPMTNPDTQARWEYYRKSFADQVRGVPCSIFNGKPATKPAQSGGGFEAAEKKYQDYCDVINGLVEENSAAKLTAEASRDGERIDVAVKVSGLTDPGADKKLRILLAEETVRYAGTNKIRMHHNVVRAFPGGVDGLPLKDAASRHKASIHLGNLRTDLTKYLDNFEATVRPFANPARPLAFTNLRVIAFVQDDATREILQAVQIEIK